MSKKDSQKRREQKIAKRGQRSVAPKSKGRYPEIRQFLAHNGFEVAGNPSAEQLKAVMLGLLSEEEEIDPEEVLYLLEQNFPGEAETLVAHGLIFTRESMVAHAHQKYTELLERWPHHHLSEGVPEMLEEWKSDFKEIGITDLSLALAQENLAMKVSHGDLEEAEELVSSILTQWPGDAPTLQSLTLMRLLEGRFEEALEVTRQTLEAHPGNVCAKVDQVHLSLLLGRRDEARAAGNTLAMETTVPLDYLKLAEGFALLGEHEKVLRVHEFVTADDPECIAIDHFAAVAHARLDRWKEARGLWERALDDDVDAEAASENLENSRLAKSQRWPAWLYPVGAWIRIDQVQFLAETAEKPNAILANHPELKVVLQNMLEFGSPTATKLVLQLLLQEPTGASAEMLQGFADGSWGTEALRELVGSVVKSGQPCELPVDEL